MKKNTVVFSTHDGNQYIPDDYRVLLTIGY